MNKRSVIALSMAILATAGTVTGASAQVKTRAEVRQELIQAENNGLQFVTDASYPDVAPGYESQAARLKQHDDSGMGADKTGSSASGKAGAADVPQQHSSCTPYCGG